MATKLGQPFLVKISIKISKTRHHHQGQEEFSVHELVLLIHELLSKKHPENY